MFSIQPILSSAPTAIAGLIRKWRGWWWPRVARGPDITTAIVNGKKRATLFHGRSRVRRFWSPGVNPPSPHELIEPMGSGQALERPLASRREAQIARARRDVVERRRHQDLPALCECRDARGENHRLAKEMALIAISVGMGHCRSRL